MDPKIRLWLIVICSQVMVIAAVTNSNDLAVLNALKSSWKNLPPQWKGADPCGSRWEGINCTNSRVTNLVLAGTGVRTNDIGDIPSLSMLQYLDLSNNKGIRATLPPSIQNLKNLTTLILVGCSFRGPIPDSIGSLKQLIFLGLNNNSFIGTIPPSIGNLTNISWLDLSDNQLTGPIPISNETSPGLDKLVKAKHFHLANNRLSGPIRSQLFHSNMSLIHVIVNNNQLSGTIPSSIGTVKTLEVIRMDSNSLSGTVPQNLSNLQTLSELYLSNNNLSGPIPNLLGMNSLSYVDMSNNSFDESDIPTWFTLLSLNTVLMEKTQLQGEIPSDVFHPQLESLVLSNNNINGTLDIGDRYSSDLIADLRNNSITNFLEYPTYNLSLNIDNNPICEAGSTGRYCTTRKPSIPTSLPSKSCPPVNCGSSKVLSPNCTCTNPYIGTIYFFSHSFSNLENATYLTTLHDTLISALRSGQLPVDSISISNATLDELKYLQYRLHIFPSSQDYFDRSSVSSIGTVINRQLFALPFYGPLFFLDESYCCFPENKSSNNGVNIGSVVGGVVVLLLIALAITYGIYQKRKATKAKENKPFASWGLDNGSDVGGAPQLKGARSCSFAELKRCTNNFSEDNMIGTGGYGKVYKGTLDTGHVVAVKRAQQGSLQGAQEFKTEIELLSRIHHKNVVALVGFCYEQGEQMLVYEYISNGTLKDNLSGETKIRLDWMKRLKIALDSAKGVTYLHELANPPIIHRDIKSNNILLDEHFTAKVADFGISKLVGDESKGYVSTQVKGTAGYMDPEYLLTEQLTEKSDVYSFGVVLLELLTARPPLKNGKYIVREVEEAIGKSNGLYTILDESLGTFRTLGGLAKFLELAMSCLQDSGVDRPKMGDVVREIETIIELAGGGDLSLTFSSQNTGSVGDLYHP
ncbi:leucine-rich repeat receptor protein kinase HPCA1-like [Bidens hawaiensis]|uniref:leucine-rich repeat receptor protein kinase HPCA1-like n=1 Tax=Bidens hawaiensis TaxID=980011 RepID=UPI00404A8E66